MGEVHKFDVVVIGGGVGGTMAALSAAKRGMKVALTEETDWLGGQLTSQAVPPDEHKWIEQFGCTQTYREFRDQVRRYYKQHYPMKEEAVEDPHLNPGNGWVSRLCHEPIVALRILQDMLAPYIHSKRITVFYHYKPTRAEVREDVVTTVEIENVGTGDCEILKGQYFLDATECGDLLPLAGVEYVTGAESFEQTGEPHALPAADPLDIQPITHVFAMDYISGGNFTVSKPDSYDFWRQYVPSFSRYPLFSWFSDDVENMDQMKQFTLFPDDSGRMPLWTYRRIIDASLFEGRLYEGDISLINWAQNDYFLGSIYEVSEKERQEHLDGARELSLSMVYWLQTEAPRPDGGKGYPGLRLRPDVLGTQDGLAKVPYIRESRRIQSLYTVTEGDVSKELRGAQGIRRYQESIGVGCYHLDIHHTTRSHRSFYIPSYPYEIPLGAIIPIRMKNVLPAAKNIGTTQITNGCYRLQPTEWNIGESVGFLAAYAIENKILPSELRGDQGHLRSYQRLLEENGVQLHWPEDME
ncbi:MAG TPA: FAD-dependent oxidoreductase [Bacillales bacterium]